MTGSDRLAQLRQRADWTYEGRTLQGWAGELARGNDEALGVLPRLGPALVPALRERFRAAGQVLREQPAPGPEEVWLWTARRPHAAAAARGRIALALERLGPAAGPAVPELSAALDDLHVCESWSVGDRLGGTARQVHVCARAAAALRAIGSPRARAALARVRDSQRVVARACDPLDPEGGVPITLARVVAGGLDR